MSSGIEFTLESIKTDHDNAFSVLQTYGVPRERAKTVSNGIMVLMTRMDRACAAQDHLITSLKQQLADMTKSRDDFYEMNRKNLATAMRAIGSTDGGPGGDTAAVIRDTGQASNGTGGGRY